MPSKCPLHEIPIMPLHRIIPATDKSSVSNPSTEQYPTCTARHSTHHHTPDTQLARHITTHHTPTRHQISLDPHITPVTSHYLQLMSYTDDRLPIGHRLLEAVLEQMSPHFAVDGRQGVVEEVDVSIAVHRPCQTDPLLLPATQINTSLPDLYTTKDSSAPRGS